MNMTGKVRSYFLIHEVEHFTGFSKYMLDYLVRDEIFQPSLSTTDRRGVTRRYSYADVVLLRALSNICQAKGKICHLRESLLQLRMTIGPLKPATSLKQLLFVEGNELCLRTSAESALVLRSGQMLLAAVVDLREVSEGVANGIVVESEDRFRLTAEAEESAERIRQRHWQQAKKLRDSRKAADNRRMAGG